MAFTPGSPNDTPHPWAPPDPTLRLGATPAAPGHGPVPQPAHTHHDHKRARRILAAACAACFLLGTAGAALIARATSNDTRSAVATVPASPATTSPKVTAPSVTTPAVTTPATSRPATTSPVTTPAVTTPASGGTTATTPTSTPAKRTSSQIDLNVGVVDIFTVLAYQQAEAAGTGMVLTADGRILTNNHVVSGATKISVTVVSTGKTYTAEVVGTDPSDDIAVLQLQGASGLTPANFGDSSTVKIGDAVTGVGNAGGRGGTPTVAPGAVTDLGQTITATDESGGSEETLHDLIQVSANLQPGESGGPLFNAAGQVIGMDTAGSTSGRFRMRGPTGSAVSSEGYAIPINNALAVVAEIDKGQPTAKITIGTPPLLGVSAADAATSGASVNGAVVSNVVSGSPADQIGLQPGDVITGVGDTKLTSIDDLTTALHAHKAGDKVTITWVDATGAAHSGTATLIAGPAN